MDCSYILRFDPFCIRPSAVTHTLGLLSYSQQVHVIGYTDTMVKRSNATVLMKPLLVDVDRDTKTIVELRNGMDFSVAN